MATKRSHSQSLGRGDEGIGAAPLEHSGFSILEEVPLFSGHLVHVNGLAVESPSGVTFEREVVRHPGAVAVLPAFADGSIMLLRQYRAPIDEYLLEVPAGKLDPGEDRLDCARRELFEETGLRPDALTHLATFVTTPGFSDERLTAFIAHLSTRPDTTEAASPDGEEERHLTAEFHPIATWRQLVDSGEVADAKTIICLALASSILLPGMTGTEPR